jgi:hypothetical protein
MKILSAETVFFEIIKKPQYIIAASVLNFFSSIYFAGVTVLKAYIVQWSAVFQLFYESQQVMLLKIVKFRHKVWVIQYNFHNFIWNLWTLCVIAFGIELDSIPACAVFCSRLGLWVRGRKRKLTIWNSYNAIGVIAGLYRMAAGLFE